MIRVSLFSCTCEAGTTYSFLKSLEKTMDGSRRVSFLIASALRRAGTKEQIKHVAQTGLLASLLLPWAVDWNWAVNHLVPVLKEKITKVTCLFSLQVCLKV